MKAPDTKYVLDLARQIEETKSHLADLEAKWEGIFSGTGREPSTPNTGAKSSPYPDGPAARILAFLESNRNAIWTVDGLEERTSLTRKQVEKALYNLAAAKKIQRKGRGQYADNNYGQNEMPLAAREASVN